MSIALKIVELALAEHPTKEGYTLRELGGKHRWVKALSKLGAEFTEKPEEALHIKEIRTKKIKLDIKE